MKMVWDISKVFTIISTIRNSMIIQRYFPCRVFPLSERQIGLNQGGNFGSHNFKKSLGVIRMNPVTGLGKNIIWKLSFIFVEAFRSEVLKPMNHIFCPSVTVLSLHNWYIQAFGWVLEQRPIICIPDKIAP